MADVQIAAIPDSTAGQMDQVNQQESSPKSPAARAAAFSVHIFTAMGAGIALIALLEAVREHWAAMFAWLGVALVIDAIDGPIARRLDVMRVLPNWSGDVLDLVVDFVTYVFRAGLCHHRERPAACRWRRRFWAPELSCQARSISRTVA